MQRFANDLKKDKERKSHPEILLSLWGRKEGLFSKSEKGKYANTKEVWKRVRQKKKKQRYQIRGGGGGDGPFQGAKRGPNRQKRGLCGSPLGEKINIIPRPGNGA